MCIDPCLVTLFKWDDWAVEAGVAGCVSGYIEQIGSSNYYEIIALLNDLR